MKNKPLYLILLISILTFISVTYIFTAKHGYMYDQAIIDWIDRISSATLVKTMDLVSMLGSSEMILFVTFGIAAIFAIRKNWSFMIFFLIVSVGGVFLNLLLKLLFQRERPGEMSNIEVFNYSLDIPSYSFPSGHTMRATILLVFLIYISSRFIRNSAVRMISYMACTVVMFGIPLSRLFLEAHFLSDTIAAMSISIAWFCLCLLIFRKYNDRKAEAVYLRW